MNERNWIHIINFLIFVLILVYSSVVYDFYFTNFLGTNIVHIFAYFAPFLTIAFLLTLFFIIRGVYKFSKIVFVNLFLFVPVMIYNWVFVNGMMNP